MSYEAKVFIVLIASPSDVEEEREIAVKTIQEWNDLNSSERQIVLLPLRWETHTAPEYGKRPQEVINRQMVDHCDLVIGIFWTRIGSPTGVADSGTLEEIERVAGQGKPVMLYFSQVKKDPNLIELDQLKRLRDFKEKTFPKALVESYSTQVEFRDKLAKQIEIQLRNLIVSSASGDEAGINPTTSDIFLEFFDTETTESKGQKIEINSTFFDVKNTEAIPDYRPVIDSDTTKERKVVFNRINTDYYRQYIEYFVKSSMFKPVRFWLKNNGIIGARDIYIDMRISSSIENLHIESNTSFEIKTPTKTNEPSFSISLEHILSGEDLKIKSKDNTWDSYIEMRALQPQREVVTKQAMLIGAESSGTIDFQVRIYADTLSTPIIHNLHIDINVETIETDALTLLLENGILTQDVIDQRTANQTSFDISKITL